MKPIGRIKKFSTYSKEIDEAKIPLTRKKFVREEVIIEIPGWNVY
jgi:hypothetical protein